MVLDNLLGGALISIGMFALVMACNASNQSLKPTAGGRTAKLKDDYEG
jgi:hypothetical protein